MSYQPKTGERCTCRPGIERDNCPQCEGTGERIDFKAIREKGASSACEHLTGYWINREAGNFRCYQCQFQFFLRDLPKRERRIEVWQAS